MSNLQRIIWLASYPKSGNTWMRSLLAHYLMPAGKVPDINHLREFTTGDTRQDIFNAAVGGVFNGKTVEDWLQARQKVMRLIAGSKPNHHFVKTHCQPVKMGGTELIPSDVTAAAIYILRNPFDLAPSFARHQSCDVDTAIDRMCNDDTMMGTPSGIFDALGRWDGHVDAWTNAPGLPLHVVRYEDLLNKPAKTMRGLLNGFLKVPLDSPKLAKAIKATSFSAMKKFEETHGFSEKPKEMKSFFTKGQAGVWREDLTPEQIERLREAFKTTLEKWYPEVLAETESFLKTT